MSHPASTLSAERAAQTAARVPAGLCGPHEIEAFEHEAEAVQFQHRQLALLNERRLRLGLPAISR